MSDERVPWDELWADARDDLLWWCHVHHIDPQRTPIDPLIEPDETTGEWRIEQYGHRVHHVAGAGAVLERVVVRRVIRAPLPWPTRDEATWVR